MTSNTPSEQFDLRAMPPTKANDWRTAPAKHSFKWMGTSEAT